MEGKTKVVSVAYPTIPIIFVASVDNQTRVPLHDTMGLAVTDLQMKTRSTTTITTVPRQGVDFLIRDIKTDPPKTVEMRLDEKRQRDVDKIVREFSGASSTGLRVESDNVDIFSGSSDSGAAAFVVGLDSLFGTRFPRSKLALLANRMSESAIRSVYGGMNAYVVSEGDPRGEQVASEKHLEPLRIFAMGFNYESRVSAQEIFDVARVSPFWQMRLDRVPHWRAEITSALGRSDWGTVFKNAEENCSNAHYLIETGGKRARRKEMMAAVIDVEEIRASGLPVYWTAGGGKIINAFSWGPKADRVLEELLRRGQKPVEYKVAPAASVLRSE